MAIQITKRPYQISFSGNPIHYELTSAMAQADATIFFEIRIMFRTLDGVFQPVAPLPYYPNKGVAQINVQDILHAQLVWQVPRFTTDKQEIQPVATHAGIFYLEFREITAANPAPSWVASESEFERVVVKGGINYFKWAGNNFFVNYFETTKPFFTWQKNGRMAAPGEHMFLLWFNRHLVPTDFLVQRITVFYTDGTNQTFDHQFPVGLSYFYYLPAGANQLDLPAWANLAGKAIYYWQMKVVATNTNVDHSEVFSYYQDNRHDDNQKQLNYRNSLGGFDSVMVRGEIEQGLDYQPQELERATAPDYFATHVVQPQRITGTNREVETFRGDIGHLPKDDQDRLRDFQLLREVYQPMKTKWWPVTITTKQFVLRKTKDFRFSMPIEWQLAFGGSVFYTPATVELGDGVFTSNVCLAKITGLTVTVDFDAPGVPETDALVTFDGVEVDTQNASTQFRYRILPTIDWTLATWPELPVSVQVPRNTQPVLEVQAICTNDIPGAKATAYIDTTVPSGGGTPPENNSIISNNLPVGITVSFVATVDGTGEQVIGEYSVGAYQITPWLLPENTYSIITINLNGVSPGIAALMTSSASYTGNISGTMVTFDNVVVPASGANLMFD